MGFYYIILSAIRSASNLSIPQYLVGCQPPPQKINPNLHREPPPQNFIGNPHLSSVTDKFTEKHINMNHIQMDNAIGKKYLLFFHSQTNELLLPNN